jgi:hypothetical protein
MCGAGSRTLVEPESRGLEFVRGRSQGQLAAWVESPEGRPVGAFGPSESHPSSRLPPVYPGAPLRRPRLASSRPSVC